MEINQSNLNKGKLMKHIIPTEVLNKVLNYLSTRPFGEVVDLITQIQQTAQLFVEPAKEECAPEEDVQPVSE